MGSAGGEGERSCYVDRGQELHSSVPWRGLFEETLMAAIAIGGLPEASVAQVKEVGCVSVASRDWTAEVATRAQEGNALGAELARVAASEAVCQSQK